MMCSYYNLLKIHYNEVFSNVETSLSSCILIVIHSYICCYIIFFVFIGYNYTTLYSGM